MDSSLILEQLADDFASVVPSVDSRAEHDRWQAGIGPFEEDRQVEIIRDAVKADTSYSIETEAPLAQFGHEENVPP